MNSRHFASRAFWVLAVFFAFTGAVSFSRGGAGHGLPAKDYLNPLFLLMIPKLIPFAAAILSAAFSAIYYGVEKKFGRPMNPAMTVFHLGAFVFAIVCHATIVRIMWTETSGAGTSHPPIPILAGLFLIMLLVCIVAFGMNLYTSVSTTNRAVTSSLTDVR